MSQATAVSRTSPFVSLDRETWSRLSDEIDVPLSSTEIEKLRGLGETLDVEEVRQVYLPVSRLLNLYVNSVGELNQKTNDFLHEHH
ncbi:MAG: type I pantothenate kinase, partial [Kocuria sp.]|nr:type I pantothenate kinase [Kocuria sp.]